MYKKLLLLSTTLLLVGCKKTDQSWSEQSQNSNQNWSEQSQDSESTQSTRNQVGPIKGRPPVQVGHTTIEETTTSENDSTEESISLPSDMDLEDIETTIEETTTKKRLLDIE